MTSRNGTNGVDRRVWPSGRVTWRARWNDISGKRQCASFNTKAEAETWLAGRVVEMHRGGTGSMDGKRTTLSEWWETWQAGRQVSMLAARREQSTWGCWIASQLGDIKLADLRRSTVQRWVAWQVRAGLASSTVIRHVGILHACLSAAVMDGLIASNPASNVDLPRASKTEQRFLSVEEVRRLTEAVEPERLRSMVAVGVACGLRIGELVALRAGDFDLVRKTVTVRRTALAGSGRYGPVKSRAGEGRVVPVPETLAQQLARELADRLPAAPVWPAGHGREWKPGNWRRDVWRPAVKRAGLVPPPTPHAMRHTAVALWLRAGASMYEASRWAGHASTSTTERIYSHLLEQDGRVSAELDRLLWPSEPTSLEDRRRRKQ
ncbi:MAG: tyrosine-type recombinase/integrase [Acidimicrobiales bacterium]